MRSVLSLADIASVRRFPTSQDQRRRTTELVNRLAQSEARASEAEKKAQQKEADLQRKLEELAQAEERAVIERDVSSRAQASEAEERAVNNDDGFSRVQASVGGPLRRADTAVAAPFSKLDEQPRCVA